MIGVALDLLDAASIEYNLQKKNHPFYSSNNQWPCRMQRKLYIDCELLIDSVSATALGRGYMVPIP